MAESRAEECNMFVLHILVDKLVQGRPDSSRKVISMCSDDNMVLEENARSQTKELA